VQKLSEEVIHNQTELEERDKVDEEVDKIDLLAKRIEQYRKAIQEQINHHVSQHNYWLTLIENTGFNNPVMDPVLLGPMILGRIEIWYSFARKEAYSVSGKCRDLQKFYEATADQGVANTYEVIRKKDKGTSTDAKEMSRRVKGRLEEKASYWEGEYMRWQGIGDAYEQTGNGCKDLYKLAEYEYKMKKGMPG
jgi:hypothetical protein